MARIHAPWTVWQVAKLIEWQACGWVHEFTCGREHGGERSLTPTRDGWRCPTCSYSQYWAHDFMMRGAPPNPLAAMGSKT